MQSDRGFSVIDELELDHQRECVKLRYDLRKQQVSKVESFVKSFEYLTETYINSLPFERNPIIRQSYCSNGI